MIKRFTLFLVLMIVLINYSFAQFGGQLSHVQTSFYAEELSIQPGKPFWVAVALEMDDHWHVYWRNPGGPGLATEITWDLPEGFSAGPVNWPYPEKIVEGPIVVFGYHGKKQLLVQITPPKNLAADKPVLLKGKINWLECADVCVPGEAEIFLAIPVKDEAPVIDSKYAELFSEARVNLPLKSDEWKIQAAADSDELILLATPPGWFDGRLIQVQFFSYTLGLMDYEREQVLTRNGEDYRLTVPIDINVEIPQTIEGILFSEQGWRGPDTEKAIEVMVSLGETITASAVSGGDELTSIWLAILFSFLGGIILNLMPCVLPVLSIKIMGIISQAHDEHAKPWQHGLVFTLGVLVSFWVLAGALLVLKAGGAQLGWGFQLQSPMFLIFLSAFMFLFGLSMFGVFEIGTSLTTVEGKTGNKSGFLGSFISGVTATIVATPCTAPFMGSALGFALAQPAWVSMAVFTFLGLGMAAPFILLSSIPALFKFIPKPGRWMESLKQFMGFLLVATVIWLLWVLGLQAGSTLVAVVLFNLLFTAIAAWVYGRWGHLAMPKKTRVTAVVAALIIITISNGYTFASIDEFADISQPVAVNDEGIHWQVFDQREVDQLVQEGKPVFLDFTAAWCLSCQFNEKVAFTSVEVQQAFNDLNINAFKADWTSRDETITRALARFGRNSVPLYVLYDGTPNAQPQILPEVITPGVILDALQSIPVK